MVFGKHGRVRVMCVCDVVVVGAVSGAMGTSVRLVHRWVCAWVCVFVRMCGWECVQVIVSVGRGS